MAQALSLPFQLKSKWCNGEVGHRWLRKRRLWDEKAERNTLQRSVIAATSGPPLRPSLRHRVLLINNITGIFIIANQRFLTLPISHWEVLVMCYLQIVTNIFSSKKLALVKITDWVVSYLDPDTFFYFTPFLSPLSSRLFDIATFFSADF